MQNCSSYGHRSVPGRIYFLLLYLTVCPPTIYFLLEISMFAICLFAVFQLFTKFHCFSLTILFRPVPTFNFPVPHPQSVDWTMGVEFGADGAESLVSSHPARLSMLDPLLVTQSSTLFQAHTLFLRRSSAWGALSPHPTFDFRLTSLMPQVSCWKSCSQGNLL